MDLRPRALFGAFGREAAGALAWAYVTLCWRTTRWRIERAPGVEATLAGGEGFLVAVWHNRLAFSALAAPKGRRTWAMISANRDGDVIAALTRRFGVSLIRGSSADPGKPGKNKQGRAAAVATARAVRAGGVVAIAVDGPRGPRLRVKPGVAALSALTSAQVVPFAISTRRGRRAGSWDGFLIPVPFDRGAMLAGEPIAPPGAGPEAVSAHREAVEAALTALTLRADALVGREPEPPAEGGGARYEGVSEARPDARPDPT